jgi:endonuclease/exonuclease/phosphatase family metal-dependent hydrolase
MPAPHPDDEIVIATYNVEALFDCRKEPEKLDDDYLPHGYWAWTEDKLRQKLANIGRVLRSIDGGRGADIVALNEVETGDLVRRLRDDVLADLGYETVVHLDTEDPHGLDNAILARYPLLSSPALHPTSRLGAPRSHVSRGILEATFDVHGVALTVFVNHWPAGGDRAAKHRLDVAGQVRRLVEARLAADPRAEIVVVGDFNASADEECFGPRGLGASTRVESARDGAAPIYDTIPEGAGTHFTRPYPYTGPDGVWNAFDRIFVSPGLLDDQGLTWVSGSTEVVRHEFLLDGDGTPRTFHERGVSPRKQALERAGFSDHLPVVTRLRRVKND